MAYYLLDYVTVYNTCRSWVEVASSYLEDTTTQETETFVVMFDCFFDQEKPDLKPYTNQLKVK